MKKWKLYLEYFNVGLLSIIVFLIPNSHNFISPFIAFWGVSSLGLIFIKKKKLSFNKPLILLVFFYILLIIGLVWTDNMKAGGFDLEVKMSLLIFPLLLLFLEYTLKQLRWIIVAFLAGLLFSCFTLILFGFSRYSEGADINTFLYSDLSFVIHPTYMSMYFVIGIMILLMDLKAKVFVFKNWVIAFLILLFFVFVLMLLSKAGVIILSIYLFIVIVIWSIQKQKIVYPIMFSFAIVCMLLFSYKKSKVVQHRVDELIVGLTTKKSTGSNGSTGIRLRIWKEGIHLIKESPIFGYGTGDVKNVLLNRYDEVYMCKAFDKRLNAHNQFIQIAISLGLVGLFVFLLSLFETVKNGFKTKNFFKVSFVVIFVMYALTESMLENQAGTIFFGLFFSLLNQKALIKNE